MKDCYNVEKCKKEWGYCGATGGEQGIGYAEVAGTLCWYGVKNHFSYNGDHPHMIQCDKCGKFFRTIEHISNGACFDCKRGNK